MGRLFSRSGISVGTVCDTLAWRADYIYHVGVGQHYEETDVLQKEWPDVKFVGFEPHPQIVKDLKGKYPGDLYAVALSDRVGTARLHVKRTHKDGSSLHSHHQTREGETYSQIEVPVTTLDRLFRSSPEGECVLLWLDCEGNELSVLKGGSNFVKGVEVMNIEMTANPPGDGWCTPRSVHDWVVGHGFVRQWVHTARIWQGQYDAIYVVERLFNPKYCCDP